MRFYSLLLAGAALSAAATAHAQQSGKPFVVENNDQGSPAQPSDARVPLTAVGLLQPFKGRTWWQTLAFCGGVYYNRSAKLKEQGQAAAAEQIENELFDRFQERGAQRLMIDRRVTEEVADGIMGGDMAFSLSWVAMEPRPWEDDFKRCDLIERAYLAFSRTAAARAPASAPVPAPVAPAGATAERRYAARSEITRRFDGQPYWKLMLQCAKGRQAAGGPQIAMARTFILTARDLLERDQGLTRQVAEENIKAALPGLQPLAPGPTPQSDACTLIGNQLIAEIKPVTP